MPVEETDLVQVAVRIDKLVDRMDAFLDHQQGGNVQTVIHKSTGIGPWGAAAVTACFMTFLGMILLAIVVIPELHDLKAWSDIYRSKIYALEKR